MEEKQINRNPITVYVCSVCGKESQHKGDIERCEKIHQCQHEPKYEFSSASDEAWWFQVKGIDAVCKHCGVNLGFADFETSDSDEILKRLFDIVTEHDGI